MSDGERELRSSLQADAESLVRAADLPSAQQALWRAKVSRLRDRRSRVAHIVTYLHCAAAGMVAAVLIAFAWRNVTEAPAGNHPMTVAAVGLTAVLAIGVLALPAFFARPSRR